MKDYYNVLGVSALAREAEIKSAFRRLVLRYHPDRNPSAEAALFIVEINEAYEILGDPTKRDLYDSLLTGRSIEIVPTSTPKHRDPAYRKRAPNPKFKSKKQQTLEMMAEYLPITLLMSRIAFALCIFIALDFFLPSTTQQETIEKIIAPQIGRYQSSNRKFFTNKGTGFELDAESSRNFELGTAIKVTYSKLVHVPTYLESSATHVVIKAPTTIYGSFIFMPILLLITSSVGAFFKRGVEFDFNIGITNLLVGIFTLAFLFIHRLV